MPGQDHHPRGNILNMNALYVSLLPPATVTTNSSVTSTYTINGLLVNDMIDLYPTVSLAPSTTYLTIGGVWVSAVNTLSVQWVNSTSASSSGSPTAIVCQLLINRSTLSPYSFNAANWATAFE
jgi:hypothetical protein